MTEDQSQVLQELKNELRGTLEKQLSARRDADGKAIDIIRLNIAIVGIVTGAALAFVRQERFILFLLFGSLSLLISTWYCIEAYSPTDYYTGIGSAAVDKAIDIKEIDEFNRKIAQQYANFLNDNSIVREEQATSLKKGNLGRTRWNTLFLRSDFSRCTPNARHFV